MRLSSFCPGRPTMMSTDTDRGFAHLAAPKASSASSAEWILPMALSSESTRDCTPIENLVMPDFTKLDALLWLKVPGLASTLASRGAPQPRDDIWDIEPDTSLSSSPSFSMVGVPPPMKRVQPSNPSGLSYDLRASSERAAVT